MNILLTGATGFVGSHLLRALLEKGYNVVIVKRSFSNCARIEKCISKCTAYNLDEKELEAIFRGYRFQAVIHCATEYGGKDSAALDVVNSNLMFSLSLLETAVRFQCEYFINTDSFFTKQLSERLWSSALIYKPEYTLSKYQFRQWGKLWSTERRINFINLQMEHIYGPMDSRTKFIPYIVHAMKTGVASLELTDGEQVRDFIHVKDVVTAYITVLENLEHLSGYQNFEVGTGVPCTLRQFVEKLHTELNSKTQLNFGKLPRPKGEIVYSVAQTDDLRGLGWSIRHKDLIDL